MRRYVFIDSPVVLSLYIYLKKGKNWQQSMTEDFEWHWAVLLRTYSHYRPYVINT